MTDDQTKSTVSARVPTGEKEDLLEIAHRRSSADDRVTVSDLLNEAVSAYLADYGPETTEDESNHTTEHVVENGGHA